MKNKNIVNVLHKLYQNQTLLIEKMTRLERKHRIFLEDENGDMTIDWKNFCKIEVL